MLGTHPSSLTKPILLVLVCLTLLPAVLHSVAAARDTKINGPNPAEGGQDYVVSDLQAISKVILRDDRGNEEPGGGVFSPCVPSHTVRISNQHIGAHEHTIQVVDCKPSGGTNTHLFKIKRDGTVVELAVVGGLVFPLDNAALSTAYVLAIGITAVGAIGSTVYVSRLRHKKTSE